MSTCELGEYADDEIGSVPTSMETNKSQPLLHCTMQQYVTNTHQLGRSSPQTFRPVLLKRADIVQEEDSVSHDRQRQVDVSLWVRKRESRGGFI